MAKSNIPVLVRDMKGTSNLNDIYVICVTMIFTCMSSGFGKFDVVRVCILKLVLLDRIVNLFNFRFQKIYKKSIRIKATSYKETLKM